MGCFIGFDDGGIKGVKLENMGVIKVVAFVMLATFLAISTTTEAIDDGEIRGPVRVVQDGRSYSWGPQEFAGFYYNVNDNVGAETITMNIKSDALEENTLPRGVVYRTDAEENDFKLEDWGSYYTIAFLGEPYFAGYAKMTENSEIGHLYEASENTNLMAHEQLSKVLMNEGEEITINSGATLPLKEGYTLGIRGTDIEGNKVEVTLFNTYGERIDSAVIDPSKIGATQTDKTYIYKTDLGSAKEIVIIAVHFKNAFSDYEHSLATIDGVWQISETPLNIEEGTEYGKMTLQKIKSVEGNMFIEMDNEDNPIKLISNKDTPLMGNIWIKVADQGEPPYLEPLRFYIYEKVVQPGTYDVRGSVSQVMNGAIIKWDTSSFAGFYYDIDNNLGTEEISMSITDGVLEEKDGIEYLTRAQKGYFEFEDWGEYWSIGFLGDGYFAAYDEGSEECACLYCISKNTNLIAGERLSKILMDDDESRTVAAGSSLMLKNGYELEIVSVDVTGEKAKVQLLKDNRLVGDPAVIGPFRKDSKIADETYTYRADFGSTEEIVEIAVHFKNAYRDDHGLEVVTVDGIWQISDMTGNVEGGTKYGKMTIQDVGAQVGNMFIRMDNRDERIFLKANKNIPLMGDIKIRTADQDVIDAWDPLRFYIYKTATSELVDDVIEVAPTAEEYVVEEVPITEEPKGIPGFGAILAVAGIVAVSYAVLNRRR